MRGHAFNLMKAFLLPIVSPPATWFTVTGPPKRSIAYIGTFHRNKMSKTCEGVRGQTYLGRVAQPQLRRLLLLEIRHKRALPLC